MSPPCITWTCGFVAQLIVAPNYYLGGRDWIPWKPEFLRLLFWNFWKLQLTCEHHSFTYMCIHQATVLVACPVFSNSNEQMVFCIHFSETHINKGHCRNINNKSASKRNEITFLKDAAPLGDFTRGGTARGLRDMFLVTSIVQDKSRHHIEQVKAVGLAPRESLSTWRGDMTGFINAYQWLKKYDRVFP